MELGFSGSRLGGEGLLCLTPSHQPRLGAHWMKLGQNGSFPHLPGSLGTEGHPGKALRAPKAAPCSVPRRHRTHGAGQGGGSLSNRFAACDCFFRAYPQRLEILGQVGLCGCLKSSENIFPPSALLAPRRWKRAREGGTAHYLFYPRGAGGRGKETSRENAAEMGGSSQAPEVSVWGSSRPGEGQPGLPGPSSV